MTLKSDHPNYRNIHRTKTKKKKKMMESYINMKYINV